MKRKNSIILNSQIDTLTFDETVSYIISSIHKGNIVNQIVVNAGKLVDMQRDQALYESVCNADLVNADGMSVVWASKFLGYPLPERVAGIDLMEKLISLSFENKLRIFFLGAKEEVVSKVVNFYSEKYGEEIIAGFRNGYFSEHEELDVAKQIAESKADMLFVAITSPKKEIFLNKYKETIKAPFTMGVGGSFDVVAGVTKRAPLWMQNIGFEWFFRLIQEPRRMWRRYIIGNCIFIYLIIRQKFGIYKNPFD